MGMVGQQRRGQILMAPTPGHSVKHFSGVYNQPQTVKYSQVPSGFKEGRSGVDQPMRQRVNGGRRQGDYERARQQRETNERRMREDEERRVAKESILEAQKGTQSDHVKDRNIRANIAMERQQRLNDTLKKLRDELVYLKQEIESNNANDKTGTVENNDPTLMAKNKLAATKIILEKSEHVRKLSEAKITETKSWIRDLESHIPLIHRHFDHQINNINPLLDHASRQELGNRWNDMRAIELRDKHHDIDIARNDLAILTKIHVEVRQKFDESHITYNIAESHLGHLNGVKKSNTLTTERLQNYTTYIQHIIKQSEQAEIGLITAQQKTNSFKPIKEQADAWSTDINSYLNLLTTHPGMINNHFDAMVRGVYSTDLPENSKTRLVNGWNDRRNQELENKKVEISGSQTELQFVQELFKADASDKVSHNLVTQPTASLEQSQSFAKGTFAYLEKVDKLSQSLISVYSVKDTKTVAFTDKISFLSTMQQALKKNETTACDTLSCEVGVKTKQLAEQVVQDVAYKAGQAVGVGASAIDSGLGVLNIITHPEHAIANVYNFAVSDNKLETIDKAVNSKLTHIQSEKDKGTIAGSFNAGLATGKLTTDVATAALGVTGTAKIGLVGARKAAALVGPAHDIPIAGTSLTISGRVLGKYSAVNPGPLYPKQGETFSGGRYSEVLLKDDTIFYRAGTADVPFGQFFSLDKPVGTLQVRIDKAILPKWPNGAKSPVDTLFTVTVPAGSKVYVGKVGTQSNFYIGGTHQIVIPSSWDIPGIKILASEPLK